MDKSVCRHLLASVTLAVDSKKKIQNKKRAAVTNFCAAPFKKGGEQKEKKKNSAREHFQEADMDIGRIPLDVRAPTEIIHPSIFHHRFSFSQVPGEGGGGGGGGGVSAVQPSSLRAIGEVTPWTSRQFIAGRHGDKPALALTDRFKLPVGLMRMSLGCRLENLEAQRRRQTAEWDSNSAPRAKAAQSQYNRIIHSQKMWDNDCVLKSFSD